MTDRHECPECGASHRKRTAKITTAARSQASHTDLQPGRCRRCNTVILRGRIGGLDTVLEQQPLNEIGWRTYAGIGRALYLRRNLRGTFAPPQSRWPPPQGREYYTEHICGKPIPELLYQNNVVRHRDDEPDNPPPPF